MGSRAGFRAVDCYSSQALNALLARDDHRHRAPGAPVLNRHHDRRRQRQNTATSDSIISTATDQASTVPHALRSPCSTVSASSVTTDERSRAPASTTDNGRRQHHDDGSTATLAHSVAQSRRAHHHRQGDGTVRAAPRARLASECAIFHDRATGKAVERVWSSPVSDTRRARQTHRQGWLARIPRDPVPVIGLAILMHAAQDAALAVRLLNAVRVVAWAVANSALFRLTASRKS